MDDVLPRKVAPHLQMLDTCRECACELGAYRYSGQSRENLESSDVTTTMVVVAPTLSLSAPELTWTRGALAPPTPPRGLGALMRA